MVRSFSSKTVEGEKLDAIIDDAMRAPSAGNTKGVALVVLQGAKEIAQYFSLTTSVSWREQSARFDGLSRAPIALTVWASCAAYIERYSEPDKVRLNATPNGAQDWGVPYWFGDAAFVVMALLLRATETTLGALFLGNFRGEEPLKSALGVPDSWSLFGTVLLGYPDSNDYPSKSLQRRNADEARVHFGTWNGTPGGT